MKSDKEMTLHFTTIHGSVPYVSERFRQMEEGGGKERVGKGERERVWMFIKAGEDERQKRSCF